MYTTGSAWPAERVARLRKMRAAGMGATEIAEKMGEGLSRNAICGALERFNVPCPTKTIFRRKKPAVAVKRPTRWTADHARRLRELHATGLHDAAIATQIGWSRRYVGTKRKGLGLTAHRIVPKRVRPKREYVRQRPRPKPDAMPAPTMRLIQLVDLEAGDCRFPIGDPGKPDFAFCGCRQWNGTSYCEYHARLCYHPGSSGLEMRRARIAKRKAEAARVPVSTFSGAWG